MFARKDVLRSLPFLSLLCLGLVLAAGCGDDDDDGGGFAAEPPALASVTPSSSIAAGGITVTLQGNQFQDGAQVRFGSSAATEVTFLDSTFLTAVVPPGSGTVDVTVTNPDTQASTLAAAFTYDGPPAVTGCSPYGGALAGVAGVDVAGTGFQDGCIVLVDGTPAANVAFQSATSVTCDFPAHAAGYAQVTVYNPDNQLGTLESAFLYADAPAPASCSPDNGGPAAGTSVTVTGTAFQGPATGAPAEPTVEFGIGGTWAAATNVTCTSATTITCDAPAVPGGTPGDADVRVTNPDGQDGTGAGIYHYNEPPEITGVSPTLVGTGGGMQIAVTGNFFRSGATVTINGADCTNYDYTGVNVGSNPDTLTCDVPANPVGTYDVVLANPDTQSHTWGPSTSGAGVQYQTGPSVTGISVVSTGDGTAPYTGIPTAGPPQTEATISGGAFTGTCRVWIGGTEVPAADVVVVNDTTIDIESVPASVGPVIGYANVLVENGTGLQGGNNVIFQYVSAPTLTLVNPASGGRSGGVGVTLTGTDFFPGATVTFGGNAATNVVLTGAGPPYVTLTCDTPAGAQGTVDVVVTNTDSRSATATNAYTQLSEPTVTNVNPSSGSYAGGTNVTVTGTDFYAGIAVTFGGNPATNVVLTGTGPPYTTLTCDTPASASLGLVAVGVSNTDGGNASANLYTYIGGQPTVTDVNSVTTYAGVSGETVTVNGTEFWPGAAVTVGGAAASSVTLTGAGPPYSSLTCDLPAASSAAGLTGNQVIVTNTDTQASTDTVYVSFRPNPGSIVPGAGMPNTATQVTITNTDGSFETGASPATVTINGAPCTNYTTNTATTIVCDTPNNQTGGPFDVVVTNPTSTLQDPSPHLQFSFGNIQMQEFTTWTEFLRQGRTNVDVTTTPGSVQLARSPGSFFSTGDIVTCAAYWEGGATPTNQRILVGTAAGGVFLTTDGGTSWTAFNTHTHSNFPTNNITCVDFYNHSGSDGSVFAVGTSAGLALTFDGGQNFTVWNTTTTPSLPHNYVWDVDWCDGVSNPTHLLAACSATGWTDTGGCLYTTDAGATTTIFDSSNIGSSLATDQVRGCDFLDSPAGSVGTAGQVFMLACHGNGLFATNGGCFLTTDGSSFAARRPTSNPNWGNQQYINGVKFSNADNTGSTYLIYAEDYNWCDQGAVFTTNDGTNWSYFLQDTFVIRGAVYDGTHYMACTASGVTITLDGSAYDTIATLSSGNFSNITDDNVYGLAWHQGMSTADDFAIACGSKNGPVVNGALEVTTNGTSASQTFTTYDSDASAGAELAQPPAVLPSADVTSVAFDPNDTNGNTFLVGTRDGAAFTADGGTSWTWFTVAGSQLTLSDVVTAVDVFSQSGNTYVLVGTDQSLAYGTYNGSSWSWSDETGNLTNSTDVTGVAFFDGQNYAVVTRDGASRGGINFYDNSGAGWSYFRGNTSGIPNDDASGVSLWRGTASMDWVLFGSPGGGLVVGRYTTSSFTTYDTNSANPLPSDNVSCVAFDQWSTTHPNFVLGTDAGAMQCASYGGGAGVETWTTFDNAGGHLPSDTVRGCAYYGGSAGRNYFAFATQGGIAYTTDGSSFTAVGRYTSPLYLPSMNSQASACAYANGSTTGDRMLLACPAPNWYDTGGVVLRAGTQFHPSGSITIGNLDGQLLPTADASVPSLPDRNVRGLCYLNGATDAQTFFAATEWGIAVTTDGGQNFTAIRDTQATNPLPIGYITHVAVLATDSNDILVGTPWGAARSTDGGASWILYNTGTTIALPSNNVRWVAYHDGDDGDTFLVVTDAGTVYVEDGSYVMTFDSSHASGPSNNQWCADFDDTDTDALKTFIISAWDGGGGSGGGAWYTTDDGGSFTRYNAGISGLPSSYNRACAISGTDGNQWVLGAAPIGTGFSGALSRTADGAATNFTNWDSGTSPSIATDYVSLVALCHQNATHWMAACLNNDASGAGISFTSDGGSTFTSYDSSGSLVSDTVLSLAYWQGTDSGPLAEGDYWALGTDDGLMVTTDGGPDLALVRKTCTGYLRIDVTEVLNGQTITYDILSSSGSPISGFTGLSPSGGSIDISGINFSTYPSIQVRVNLSTSNTSQTPVLQDLQVLFTY